MNHDFEFDFEEWAELAKLDPEEFDRRRDLLMAKLREGMEPASSPPMDGTRWRIDIERQRCTTSLQLSLRLYSLMWDRLYDLRNSLQELNEASQKVHKLIGAQNGDRRKTDKNHLSLVKINTEE